MSEAYRVEMANITKAFGGIHALSKVSLRVKAGEIHALVGENGAGKSTLMKILSGAYQKDFGSIKIDGQSVEIANPHAGRKLGIGIIYQEFALAPDLTVAENIYLGHLSRQKGVINWSELYKNAEELIRSIGFRIDPRQLVGELSVAHQQVVEITKALSENVKILILDEPTAVLAPQEANQLFEVLQTLKQQGVSIIYISHRLDEIFRIADIITVVKDGSVTGTVKPEDVTTSDLINLMIGRTLSAMFPERNAQIGKKIFSVDQLQLGEKVQNISFFVRAGEVLGIAGLVGSGRTETVRAIFGADRKEHGTITLDDRVLHIRSPRDAVKSGIGLLPENRKEQGVILSMSLRANMSMANLQKVVRKFGVINATKEKELSLELIRALAIKANGPEAEVSELSGGNQQKVALAKWFGTDCQVLILDEPTRGVDVGAKVEIYTLINQLAEQGLGIIVISSEMIEVIGICDRVMVMREGKIQGILPKEELSEENIMRLAIGYSKAQA